MLKRRRIILSIAIVSVVFIGIQIIVSMYLGTPQRQTRMQNLKKYQQKNHESGYRKKAATHQVRDDIELMARIKRDNISHKIWDVMASFIEMNNKHGIYLEILPHGHSLNMHHKNNCHLFCNSSFLPFTFFLTWHQHEVNPASVYRQNGFNVLEEKSTSHDISLKSLVSTHILLSHRNVGPVILIHLVFVYTFMNENFRWFATLQHTQGIDTKTFNWSTAGVFQIYKTKSITVDNITITTSTNPSQLLESLSRSHYIECNHTRAALFRSLYHKEANQDEYQFIYRARDIIEKATGIFHRLHVAYWLSSGTCLGWFRQCSVIPYSIDVDFGVRIEDYDERIVPTFQNAGFKLKMILGRRNDSFELSFYNDGIKVDIFFFYTETDHMWNGGTQHDDGQKYKYRFPKFSICWSSLLGLVVRVPCETEAYITANYGPNWFTPVTTWSWSSSAFNVELNGVWREDEMDEVVQIFDVETPDEFLIDLHKQH